MSSQTPAFDLLRSPSPDQTTLSQHFPKTVKKAVANPYKKVNKRQSTYWVYEAFYTFMKLVNLR